MSKQKTICVQYMFSWCSDLVVLYWTSNSMDNILSYCGLVDARISTSEKDWFFGSLQIFGSGNTA